MAETESGSLQIDQNERFERRDWRAQRVGWALLALVAVLALAGLFGGGPLSARDAQDAGRGLSIHYDRFVHRNAPAMIEVRVAPSLIDQAGQARVWIDREYAEALGVQSAHPDPVLVEAVGSLIIYTFALTGRDRPVSVTFALQPTHVGEQSGRLGVLPAAGVPIRQFIYP